LQLVVLLYLITKPLAPAYGTSLYALHFADNASKPDHCFRLRTQDDRVQMPNKTIQKSLTTDELVKYKPTSEQTVDHNPALSSTEKRIHVPAVFAGKLVEFSLYCFPQVHMQYGQPIPKQALPAVPKHEIYVYADMTRVNAYWQKQGEIKFRGYLRNFGKTEQKKLSSKITSKQVEESDCELVISAINKSINKISEKIPEFDVIQIDKAGLTEIMNGADAIYHKHPHEVYVCEKVGAHTGSKVVWVSDKILDNIESPPEWDATISWDSACKKLYDVMAGLGNKPYHSELDSETLLANEVDMKITEDPKKYTQPQISSSSSEHLDM